MTVDRTRPDVPAVLLGLAGAALGLAGAGTAAAASVVVGGALAVAWAGAAVLTRAPRPALARLAGTVAVVVGAWALAAARLDDGDPWPLVAALAAALLGALVVLLGRAVPDGRLPAPVDRVLVGTAGVVAVGLGLALGGDADLPVGPLLAWWSVTGVVAAAGYLGRCRRATVADRARLQWIGWGVVVAGAVAVLVILLDLLLDWSSQPAAAALAATVAVPIGLVASTVPRLLTVVDRVLVRTVVVVGLVALVEAVYLFVVVGLGRVPESEERSVLVLSMVAAAVCAVLAFPARQRLEELANQRVYGERHRPDDALRTFAGRMTRAAPMDELLLQLAESLKKSLRLTRAEVWTGVGGHLERAVSVPDQGPGSLVLAGEELGVAARAHVQGNAWLQVWVPAVLDGRGSVQVRAAMVAHLGELLGLLVLERPADDPPFTEADDRALAELARQVGLALHNVRLDSALQASLEELEVRNQELVASRRRIVTAADESRRQIERNLHDGAQQHLVALAVKVGLVKQLIDADRATADEMLDQLRGDVQDTLEELRELAHGIYPPLLRDRGLAAALQAAANRSALPAELVVGDGVTRHEPETEAAVYFCCLEAMQNAGKHAGDDAHLTITVDQDDAELSFEVADDGPGFDVATVAGGHGFVNMRDRLGAIGGTLVVDSVPGAGARIRGRIPLDPAPS